MTENKDKTKSSQTMIAIEYKPETMEVIKIMDELSSEEQKECMVFMQGVKFAKIINKKTVVHAI